MSVGSPIVGEFFDSAVGFRYHVSIDLSGESNFSASHPSNKISRLREILQPLFRLQRCQISPFGPSSSSLCVGHSRDCAASSGGGWTWT